MSLQKTDQTPVDYTFTCNGSKADLISKFQTKLTEAGWHVVSGAGTSDVVMETATTPQGLKIRVEAKDAGGTSVQFILKDNTTLVGSQIIYLLPASTLYRLWADKYQFFYFTSGTDMSRQRAFVCGGSPWVPTFVKDTMISSYGGWLHGPGTSDTDTTPLSNNTSFRTRLIASGVQDYTAIWNNVVNGNALTFGKFGLLCQSGGTNFDDQWETGTWTIFEPVLVWQHASFPGGPVRYGQIWDALILTKSFDSETLRTFGGFTWRSLTHQNQPTGAVGRGSLMLIVPDA